MSGRKKPYPDFNLPDVIELGGEKEDYELVAGVDGDEEEVEIQEDLNAEPISRDELRKFIKNLNLNQFKEEPKKLKKVKKKELNTTEEVGGNSQNEERFITVSDGKISDDSNYRKKSKDQISGSSGKKSKNKYKVQEAEVSSTTSSVLPTTSTSAGLDYTLTYEPRKHLLVRSTGNWWDQFASDPTSFQSVAGSVSKRLEEYAGQLLQDDDSVYKKQKEREKKSDTAWMRTVLTSGTLSDKTAALTLLVQEDPIHNLTALDSLIGMVRKKGRKEALMSLDSLRELFLGNLLPDDRKLRSFEEHALTQLEELSSGNRDTRDRRLLLWYFESQLKRKYADFVQGLQSLLHDTVDAVKRKGLGAVFELLAGKPEQEKVLLSLLVNKLGDPDYKTAAMVTSYLGKLVDKHPNMKKVVVLEVERLLYRPNISTKAQYYAICFLNQILLSSEEEDLAARLITIYFSFFKVYVKRGEVDSKMLSGLLTGVNRAYPYSRNKENLAEQMGMLYQMVHIVNFNTSVQALMLLYQVLDSGESSSNRYYMALYRKMLDPSLKSSSKQPLFLNLLYRSMRKDSCNRRVKAFVKRLLQICCHQSPPFICGALILLSELLKVKTDLLNLNKLAEESDDEEEHFRDLPAGDESEGETNTKPDSGGNPHQVEPHARGQPRVGSWVHRDIIKEVGTYDAVNRNPLYSHAEQECVWELKRLTRHYHPSVVLFASKLLKDQNISYSGDPLQDFTMIRFLDRFVYRNPKKREKLAVHSSVFESRHKHEPIRGVRGIPVNSEAYLQKGEDNIPADEKFFYRYFSQMAVQAKKKKPDDIDSDAESVSDTEFDQYLETFEKGLVQDEDIEFDFAGEFGKQKTKHKKRKGESDDEDEDDVDVDLSDEEEDFGDPGEFSTALGLDEDEDGSVGFDEEDVAFTDDDDLDTLGDVEKIKSGKRKESSSRELLTKCAKKHKGMKGAAIGGLFVAAEEFADMIDENAGSSFDLGGSQAMANKDNAGVKQLKWEQDREAWMKDNHWRKKKFGSRGKFTGKQTRGGKPKRGPAGTTRKQSQRKRLPSKGKSKGRVHK